MVEIKDVKELKFWCHKVLPLVYDDSLSYYEVLCKVVAKLNEMVEIINGLDEQINAAIIEYVNEYMETWEVPLATANKNGGLRAEDRSSEFTSEVKIDRETGKLYVVPYTLPVANGNTLGGVIGDGKTDDDTVPVHIDNEGRMYVPNMESEPYELPIASENVLGGVKGEAKTTNDTVPVHIDNNGNMWVEESGGATIEQASENVLGGIYAKSRTYALTNEVKIDPNTGLLYSKDVIDNYVNIQQYMNENSVDFDTALEELKNQKIYLASGMYTSKQSHNLGDRCHIVGDNASISIRDGDDSFTEDYWLGVPRNTCRLSGFCISIQTSNIKSVFEIIENTSMVSMNRQFELSTIIFKDIIIENTLRDVEVDSTKHIVNIGLASRSVIFENCWLNTYGSNFASCVYVTKGNNVIFKNCRFSNDGTNTSANVTVDFSQVTGDIEVCFLECIFNSYRAMYFNGNNYVNARFEGCIFKKLTTQQGISTIGSSNNFIFHSCIFEAANGTVGALGYIGSANYYEIIGCVFPINTNTKPMHCFDLNSDSGCIIMNNQNCYYGEVGGLLTLQGDLIRGKGVATNSTGLLNSTYGASQCTIASCNVRNAGNVCGGFITFTSTNASGSYFVTDDKFIPPCDIKIPIYRDDTYANAGYISIDVNGRYDCPKWDIVITDTNFTNSTIYRTDFCFVGCTRKRSDA